ncbi:MAG: hypothetical protein WC565_06920 [Parcubacteria group bacterium]
MSELSDMERGDLEEACSLCAVTLANREAENTELKRQRDALLAACKASQSLIRVLAPHFRGMADIRKTLDEIEDAIVLAKGGES